MRRLLPLAALLLLSIGPAGAEVVTSMSECAGFFLGKTPPRIPGILEGGDVLNQNRYKPICQTLEGNRTFVTLYDTANKIPVFSAYMYRGRSGKRPPNFWRMEPQLEDISLDNNMKKACRHCHHQAGTTDYKNSQVFNRGHLLPSSYGLTQNEKRSTFTLTNIVPQVGTFNKGSWSRMESCVGCVLDRYCRDNNGDTRGFVVVGAQPSANDFLNNRINIPSRLWSAFCCYSRGRSGWLAGAHWGENVPQDDTHLQTHTLAELHAQLGAGFEAFPATQCPLHATVAQLYPSLNAASNECRCPPPVSTTSGPLRSASAPASATATPLIIIYQLAVL